ncbi:MAG: peptide ABC transporter ATP-binding protein [Desulfobacterium sp.]|nr:peptide ABC transporter ATP-binding protein [Desulfobacterium sp.]
MLLKVLNLCTYYQTGSSYVRAVDDISFELAKGETLGVVGESGCGKTAAALSLMRLIPSPGRIVSGKILFEGKDITALSIKELLSIRGDQIAMIFQDPMTALNPVLSIGEQLVEPFMIHRRLSRKVAIPLCIELLNKVRIPDAGSRMKSYPHELSGGMRQRVMIAMALALNPKIIIADEPTTALDVSIQAELLELLKNITREQNASLMLITHNLGIVARYADRVMIMYAGRIVEKAFTLNLYQTPLHPYTKGLLDSVPRLNQNNNKKLTPIKGQPPDLANLPQGCAFYERCTLKEARCKAKAPTLKKFTCDHEVACWLKEEGK